MENLKTSEQVATRLKISQRRVQQLADELGIEKRYGKFLFVEEEILTMRRRNKKVGRKSNGVRAGRRTDA